ncbi:MULTISPECIES: helix-turn-helix transcriptional regulator [Vibrio]|uniref:helix-turn-helix domain-containing protein n=1 Tax=Vibrio sp. 99-70-13A1 TaxID=2607601 RepID=UPI0011975872|nr:helix-turn-helix transcriptional regulator [Vibrio sp. 99-70-13A1]TVU79490.1 helix-turn-helix transcriptional regulator [Vibrio tasmaniensis]
MEEDSVLKAFGKIVLKSRTELGLSQEKLAEIAGLDRTYISSVERGQRNISLMNIVKLAHALSVEPCDLLKNIGGYIE